MTNDEIRIECSLQYFKIKQAEDRLKEIRNICNHERTFHGNYSYRIGAISPAIICSDCGSLIKYLEYIEPCIVKEKKKE